MSDITHYNEKGFCVVTRLQREYNEISYLEMSDITHYNKK